MSNILRLPDRDDPAAEACEWLAKLERGLSEQEERDLRAWLAANSQRGLALIETAGLWDRMNSLSRLADLFPKPEPRPAARPALTFAFAVVVLLVVAASLFAFLVPGLQRESATRMAALGYTQLFETAVGEQSTIRLPDGSELTLNTNSRVRADFARDWRTLRLERGEVFVHVAHDEKRPFLVLAADQIVRAVGTSFNVEITRDQNVEVIVTEGKVLIGMVKADAPVPDSAWLEQFAIPIAAGERVLISQDQPSVKEIDGDEIDVKLSWRAGNIVFHGEPLVDALGEIERYTKVTFVIRDEELKAVRVAGLFKAGDVDGLLKTLRENFNISYERVGTEKIVLKQE